MMRRSSALLVAAPTEWSTEVQQRMQKMTHGAVFDTTVLDKSVIPTKHFQKSLFRLPIPKLEDTCKRYLECVQPLVPPNSFDKTKSLVEAFQAGEGLKLHEELVTTDKSNPHTSYISADWFDLYLEDRQPLPINYNACLITRNDPDKPDSLLRATFWISSSVRFYQAYLNRTLKPEVFYFCKPDHYCRQHFFQKTVALMPQAVSAKVMAIGSRFMAFPLDMSQNDNLFNSTRVPGVLKDEIKAVGFQPHIMVCYRGHQFVVNVADKDANPIPDEQIYARLREIVNLNPTPASTDVGIFTTLNRSEWASARVTMLRNPVNQKSLEMVDSAMFVLSLDENITVFTTSKDATAATRDFIAKDSNRWWDKSFSVNVTKNGSLGVSFEHAWGDGVAVLRYTQDIFNDSVAHSAQSTNKSAPATESVQQLSWVISPELAAVAARAKQRLQGDINAMDFHVGMVDVLGKSSKIFKGHAKPDPFMQVAMQLAWWRLNKSTVSTYESASTAAFLRGRTECIRSATMESQKFCLLMDSSTATADEKVKALLAATNKHAARSKEAKMGGGVDRHLFSLRKVAQRKHPNAVPDLFKDPSYATLGSNMISTSSLYSDALLGGGFGPVSPGYGVGYAAADDLMLFNISAWKSGRGGPNHSPKEFFAAIYECATEMRDLITSTVTK